MDETVVLAGLGRGAVAMVAVEADGRVGFHNRAAVDLLGELEGVNLSAPPACDDPRSPLTGLVDAWEALREQADSEVPRLIRVKKGGASLFLWTQSLPLGERARGGRLFLLADLTAFLAGAEPVRRLVSQLAHDLRSPLTSISGAAELLLSGRVGALQGVQEKLVRIVEDGAGRMNNIISSAAEEGTGREKGGHAA